MHIISRNYLPTFSSVRFHLNEFKENVINNSYFQQMQTISKEDVIGAFYKNSERIKVILLSKKTMKIVGGLAGGSLVILGILYAVKKTNSLLALNNLYKTENDSNQETIKNLTVQIAELHKRSTVTIDTLKNLQKDYQEAQNEIKQLKTTIKNNELVSNGSDKKLQDEQNTTTLVELAKNLHEAQNQNIHFAEEISTLTQKNNETEALLDDAQNQIQGLQRDLNQSKYENSQLQEDFQNYKKNDRGFFSE